MLNTVVVITVIVIVVVAVVVVIVNVVVIVLVIIVVAMVVGRFLRLAHLAYAEGLQDKRRYQNSALHSSLRVLGSPQAC